MMTAGYNCTRADAWPGAWDVIETGSTDVVLCPVKSNEWPRLEALRLFPAPA